MNDTPTEVNGWAQLDLLSPVVREYCIRVGVMPDDNHAQLQYEVSDPATGRLVAMHSVPHVTPRDLWAGLHELYSRLCNDLEDVVEPF